MNPHIIKKLDEIIQIYKERMGSSDIDDNLTDQHTNLSIDGFKSPDEVLKFLEFLKNPLNLKRIKDKNTLKILYQKYHELLDFIAIADPYFKAKAKDLGVIVSRGMSESKGNHMKKDKIKLVLESVKKTSQILKEGRFGGYSSDDGYDADRDARAMGYRSARHADTDNWGQPDTNSPEYVASQKANQERLASLEKKANEAKQVGIQRAEKAWNNAGGDQDPKAGEAAVMAEYQAIRKEYTAPNQINPNNTGYAMSGAATEWLAKKLGFPDAYNYWENKRKQSKQNVATSLVQEAAKLLEKAKKKIGQNPKRFTKKGERQIAHITKSEIEAGKSPEEAKKIACATATKTGNRKEGK